MSFRIFMISNLILVMIVMSLDNVSCTKSGMYTYVSKDALREIAEASVNYHILDKIKDVKVADLHGKSLYGATKWELTNLSMTALEKPKIDILLNVSKVATVKVSWVTFKISGRYRISILGIHHSGVIEGTICGNGVVSGTLGEDDIARIQECDANANCGTSISLDITSRHNFIQKVVYDQINAYFTGLVSSRIKDMVCLRKRNLDFNNDLYVIYPLNNMFAINGRFTGFLSATTDSLVVGGVGAVFKRNDMSTLWGEDNPFEAPDITPINIISDKMVMLILTNYTVSTFVLTTVNMGSFDNDLDPQSLLPEQRILFAVECLGVCIGTYIPTLKTRFPGQLVNVRIAFTKHIMSSITVDGIQVYNTLTLDFHVGNYSIVKLCMHLTTSIKPYIAMDTIEIRGSVNNITIGNVKMLSSNVGHLPLSTLTWLANIIKKLDLLPRIKDIANTGINLGSFETGHRTSGWQNNLVMYKEAYLSLHDGTVNITANLVLQPNLQRQQLSPAHQNVNANIQDRDSKELYVH